MNRDLQTTAEVAYAVRPYSLTGSLWWLLPPAAALFYPLALRALYESGKLLHRASGPDEGVAFLAIVVSAGLIYSVPAVGIVVAYLFGRDERTSPSELIARRLAHEASRPLADRFAGAVVAAGTVFAVTITIAQLSVHGAS